MTEIQWTAANRELCTYIHRDGFWHGSWNFAFGQDFRSYRVGDRTQRLGMFNTDVFSPQDTSLIDSDVTISTKRRFAPIRSPTLNPLPPLPGVTSLHRPASHAQQGSVLPLVAFGKSGARLVFP